MSEQIITKHCYKCKQYKPITEFYTDRSRPDNLTSACKQCGKEYDQKNKSRFSRYYIEHKEDIWAYYRRPDVRFKQRLHKMFYRIKFPEKIKARRAIRNMVRAHKIPRPDTLQCFYCDKQAQRYHHWHGYTPKHWLDVVPACAKCDIINH